jgi:single-stranded-DNA-specific exonuclease
MQPRWHLERPDPGAVDRLRRELALPPAVAAVLANRGILDPEAARIFLHPELDQMPPPERLGGLDQAAARVGEAIRLGQKILVFADYDVDGVTAAALLWEFLTQAGARVQTYIPDRCSEGYGLQPRHVHQVAALHGCRLILTADCGAAGHAAVRAAADQGIDVVVTDHHQPSPEPLGAAGEVNPARDGPHSPLGVLAGVGVAFYLIIGVRTYLRRIGFWHRAAEPNLRRLLDLVAIGTVADMVPLTGVNRVLVHAGLEVLGRTARPGIEALMAVSAVSREQVGSEDIAFRLAPRLNAAGRLAHADLALALLTAADPSQARDLAARLDTLNTERRHLEGQIVDDAVARLQDFAGERHALVVAGADWHAGVVGIVASRLARRFHRPAVVLCGGDGVLKGSARSIPGVNIYQALERTATHLAAFGGHPMAAGLQLPPAHLQTFARHLDQVVARLFPPSVFTPTLNLDAELDLDHITPDLMTHLASLEPFGSANPEPLFCARGVKVATRRIVGQRHLSLSLCPAAASSTVRLAAIHFNAERCPPVPEIMDRMAFRARWNHWNGRRQIQLVIAETA